MSCPRNAFGQPLCNLVEHPDHLGESFCSTCNKRFQSPLQPHQISNHRPDRQSGGQLPSTVIEIITGVVALLIAAAINNMDKGTEPYAPPAQNPSIEQYKVY